MTTGLTHLNYHVKLLADLENRFWICIRIFEHFSTCIRAFKAQSERPSNMTITKKHRQPHYSLHST